MEGQSTHPAPTSDRAGRLARLAHFTTRYRWPVIAAWIVLTLFGGVAAGQALVAVVPEPAVPGQAGLRGGASGRSRRSEPACGRRTSSSSTRRASTSRKSPAVRAAMARVAKANPGALTSSYFSTGNPMYVSRDRHTTFLQVYLPGRDRARREERRREDARRGGEPGFRPASRVNVTGRDALEEANDARLERRVERPPGGADRRPRRAR